MESNTEEYRKKKHDLESRMIKRRDESILDFVINYTVKIIDGNIKSVKKMIDKELSLEDYLLALEKTKEILMAQNKQTKRDLNNLTHKQ